MLLALEGCSRDSSRSAGERPGGSSRLPTSSTLDPGSAGSAVGGDGFVMDVQNHLLAYDLSTLDAGGFGTGCPQASCDEASAEREQIRTST